MPGYDRTGPWGQGPLSGGGRGLCGGRGQANGRRIRMNRGGGFGPGRWLGGMEADSAPTGPGASADMDLLLNKLEAIEARLADLEKDS